MKGEVAMRKWILLVAVSLAIAGVFLSAGPTINVGAEGRDALRAPGALTEPQDDPYQPWGTWAWSTHRPAGGAFPALVTYNRDGTLTGADVLMNGITFPPAVNPTRMSPFHGVWERTGPHSFRGMSLWMQYDVSGNVTAWGRSRSDLHFVDDADHVEGRMWIDSLPCPTPFTCPDPLTTEWTSAVAIRDVSLTRMTRIEPPGV
jgi:hypothetical protein